ncbi:MAG: hypothetical protein S0880_11390 [Actinomycetota bacterium]|nr:hypothetical protein [Actinomycetota bacterium]
MSSLTRKVLGAGAAVAALAGTAVVAGGPLGGASETVALFELTPTAPFLACMQEEEGVTPTALVRVSRRGDNDSMTILLRDFKPGLDVDLFTIENSPLDAYGQPDPDFDGFGLAWYQTDISVGESGNGVARINTVLLDEIFGLDDTAGLEPTNTFHVGFWFNDPADAAACGFEGSTPFNGEQEAGPLAAVSLPDAATDLGPLCLSPEADGDGFRCDP